MKRYLSSPSHTLGLLVLLTLCMGCGDSSGIKRVVVQGDVTYDGKPIPNGQIYFYPLEDTAGPVSGGPIVDGHYRAEAGGGVPVGNHRIEISGYKSPPGGGGGDAPAPRVAYVPAKYNSQSKLTTSIDGKDDPKQLDFNLDK